MNKNTKNKESVVEPKKKIDITKKMLKNDDDSVIEIEIDKDEIQKLPANINFRFETFCNSDDSLWLVDESSDLTEGDLDIPLCSTVIKDDHKNKTNILTPSEKLEKMFSDQQNLKELGTEEQLNLPAAKKLKRPQDEDVHNSKIGNIDEISLLDMKLKSSLSIGGSLKKNINNDQGSNETNLDSSNSCKLHSSAHLTDISRPSCSKNLTSLPGPSNSSKSLNLPDSFDAKLNDPVSSEDIKEETRFLKDYYRECFLKDTLVTLPEPEDVEVQPLEECEYVKFVESSLGLENDNEILDPEESNDFVEDPDIVNPEIVYNIELNEHYKQMDILVQQIFETPDDPTLLDECIKLPPIPQVEHEPTTFTTEERLMFMNGCSKWDYKIDRDDWTKIMVKRAVIFTAHAGFTIANEESLYVLADVIIDYIKRLAVIMKKNFDIQSNSSYSTSIDPINLSLQEIGVEGGIKEVMEHYENDIFDRRDKLMKKCQHLQKVIDQYVERTQLDNSTSNQYVPNEDFIEETLASDTVIQNDENVPSQKTLTETVVEIHAEFKSLLEEIQNESHPTTEENTTANNTDNIVSELTEPVYVDNVSDIESKMDSNSKSIESINTDAMEIRDRKINNTTTVNTKIKDIDLLTPFTLTTEDETTSKHSRVLNCFQEVDKEKFLKEWVPSCSESFAERKKKTKMFDQADVRRMLAHLYPPEIVEHDARTLERMRMEKEFNDDFERFQIESKNSSKEARSSKKDKKIAKDKSTPIQTVFASDTSDEDEKKDTK